MNMKSLHILGTLTLALLPALAGFTAAAQDRSEPAAHTAATAAAAAPSKSNMTVKEWNVDAATNRKILDHVTIYNEAGKKIEESEYDSKGLKWKKRYEHGANGKVARETVYNSANKLDNIRKIEYDGFGRKKAEYIYDAKGKLKKYHLLPLMVMST